MLLLPDDMLRHKNPIYFGSGSHYTPISPFTGGWSLHEVSLPGTVDMGYHHLIYQ